MTKPGSATLVQAVAHVPAPAEGWQQGNAMLDGDPYCLVEAYYRNMDDACELFSDVTHLPPEQAVELVVNRGAARGIVIDPGEVIVFDDDDGRRCWLFRGWHLSRAK
jgi:hypothetical protein